MKTRLSFTGRIGLIMVLGVVTAWLIVLALFYNSRDWDDSVPPPPAGQVAALVSLLEREAVTERPLILEAVNSDSLLARIEQPGEAPPQQRSRPPNDDVVASYVAALDGRRISVNYLNREVRIPGLARFRPPDLEIRVTLKSGDVLNVRARSNIWVGPFGFPVGFGAGFLGTLIAIIVLVAMYRETKPLARLARAVDGVDLSVNPVMLPDARRSAPEIRALVAAFNRLQGRLAELLRARMAMLGGISHDVRTFATRLRLRIDGISDEAERNRAIADIDDMIHLLDDALLASRAGAGELAEEMVEIDDIIVAEVADRQVGGARIDYHATHWKRPPIVLGDRLALRRVIANLADNAIKYGKVAHLSTDIDGHDIVLVVDDDGPGIPSDQRQAMLEPFSRLETSRSRGTGGAGLGLAVVSALVAAHGGTLAISESPAKGARITVRWPLFQAG